MRRLGRRSLLRLLLAGAAGGAFASRARAETRQTACSAEVALLLGMLRFEATGMLEETIDLAAGRYEVRLRGQGTGITTEVESHGALREGRWAPLRTHSRFVMHGRESSVDVTHHPDRRLVEYRSRQETFLRRRLRVTDDVVRIPDRMHVDDTLSATLNHASQRWPPEPDGSFLTHAVRRRRRASEGPDDAERGPYRAELVPFRLRVSPDGETGKPTALIDLTPFSSWARADSPARVVFGRDRRPELITASLMLGTSFTIRFEPARTPA